MSAAKNKITDVQNNDSGLHGQYKSWFLDYASYVILERAVPAVEDGLKPVQRRILHAMNGSAILLSASPILSAPSLCISAGLNRWIPLPLFIPFESGRSTKAFVVDLTFITTPSPSKENFYATTLISFPFP